MAKRGRKPIFHCPDVAELRALVESGKFIMQIVRHYGRPIKTIYRWLDENGIRHPDKRPSMYKWGKGVGSIYTSQGKAWQALNTQEKIDAAKRPGVVERFWEKVKKGQPHQCWLWTAAIHRSRGYGQSSLGGFNIHAHRVAWMLTNGPIPADMHVLHSCDTKLCVNPRHLFLGSNEDNYADRDRKGRVAHGVRAARAKLTPEQVREIRKAVGRNTDIGRRFGIDGTHVLRIKRREKWARLPD